MNTILSTTGLTRTFGGLRALDQLNLAVAAGSRHAVIGPNGAGKTTLLHLIAGTLPSTSGHIRWDGRDITRTTAARRSQLGIARTFQTPALLDTLTATDNLVVGAWRHIPLRRRWLPSRYRRLAVRALHQLDALGIAHLAGVPAGRLSHGQRRLLEIGVALIAGPRLLLLDEPAAGLGDIDLARLLHCLHQLPNGVTVVMVEHHIDVVTAVADTITVLHHGRLLAEGAPEQVTSHPEVIQAYLGDTRK